MGGSEVASHLLSKGLGASGRGSAALGSVAGKCRLIGSFDMMDRGPKDCCLLIEVSERRVGGWCLVFALQIA